MQRFRTLLLALSSFVVGDIAANPLCSTESAIPAIPQSRQLPYAGLCESIYYSWLPDDYFYTASWSQHAEAQTTYGLAAVNPPVSIYLEGRNQIGTFPLYRFFSPSAVAHYYSTDKTATNGMWPYDWIQEKVSVGGVDKPRVEGYVYPNTSSAPIGAVAIRRWVRHTPELAYRMTLGSSAPGSGWLADGIVGYGFPAQGKSVFRGNGEQRSVSSDWLVTSGTNLRMMRRCLSGATYENSTVADCSARGQATTSGAYYRTNFLKSADSKVHTLSFRFGSSGFFSHGNNPGNSSHISAGTRGFIDLDYIAPADSSDRISYHGLGIIVGAWDQCSKNGLPHVVVEAWWPTGNNGVGAAIDSASCSPALESGKKYQIDLATSDTGALRYALYDVTDGTQTELYVYQKPNATALFPSAALYPASPAYANRIGAWLIPIVDFGDTDTSAGSSVHTDDDEFTIDIWNIKSIWRQAMPTTPL